ncbi:ABC transporter substrate-binding protein [Salidesulfovibrio onnuriiensis]|uniref:ABC transporter substrate-binding protein n=1 Tax=Salidesulfovibrio onnuriiensis TaxID=2583823 RepID=UPI0011CB5E39|nr:ABC transporter substrate-binding protein [Salidesulfovibrio onnuriiensis]
MKTRIAALAALFVLAAWGGLHLIHQTTSSASAPGQTVLSVYTTGQATTPQMPLWKALAEGDLSFTPDIHYWKNLDDLRGLLLAGKGDIWVGHIDGFAQAAMRGAPVRLVSVTGWKKFYLLTSRPGIRTFDDILALPTGAEIASTPPHSPGAAVLRALEKKGLPAFTYAPYEPKQLALMAVQGKADLLLLPEPLVTVLLRKAPHLRIVASVEEEYGRLTGKPAMLPIAGIAVNLETLKNNPGLADRIARALAGQEAELKRDPAAGLDTMPKEFEKFIPRDMVLSSLERDIIHVRSAHEARDMIRDYLDMVFSGENGEGSRMLPESFFGGAS